LDVPPFFDVVQAGRVIERGSSKQRVIRRGRGQDDRVFLDGQHEISQAERQAAWAKREAQREGR